MPNTPDTSFPAVAGGASAEERPANDLSEAERYGLAWLSNWAIARHGDAKHASAVLSLLARYEAAAKALLRATPAAPVGAPSEDSPNLREWLEEEVVEQRALKEQCQENMAHVVELLTDARAEIEQLRAAALGASLSPVEGAGVEAVRQEFTRTERSGDSPTGWTGVPFLDVDALLVEVVRLRAAASDRDAARWRAVRERSHMASLENLAGSFDHSLVTTRSLRYPVPLRTPDDFADALLAQQAPQEGPRP